MPGSRRERNAAPAQALRLQAAAQSPAPIPLTPSPRAGLSRELGYPTEAEVREGRPDLLGRVLGERYPNGGEERQAARQAAADRHARAGMGHAAPEQAPHGPLGLSLPPEVERGLAAPPRPSQGPPLKGPEWDRLHDPLPASPLAEATMRLLCQPIASHGLDALRPRVAHDCRRAASIALTGREA